MHTGWRDTPFLAAFWVHVLSIAIVAFALGVPAVRRDAARSAASNAGRAPLDLNADLFFYILLVACVVGAVASISFIMILQRFASSLIYCALYSSLALQAAFTVVFFVISPPAGIVMALILALQAVYVYCIRKRIAFATAHVKAAVAALQAHRIVFAVAIALVFVQVLWVMLWELASLGVQSAINTAAAGGNGTAALGAPAAPANGTGAAGLFTNSTSSGAGGAVVFAMTVSLYWGTQTFMYASHFVVAAVVGSWWFTPNAPSPVKEAVRRAFTTNFGSLSLGALIVAVIEACKRAAQAAHKAAEKNDAPPAIKVIACLCVCALKCVEDIVEYVNAWAIIFIALTGKGYVASARDVWTLFKDRGWTAIINDDLVGPALKIASLAPAALAAIAGAGICYAWTSGAANSLAIVLIAAVLSFIVGMTMATIMTGVVTAGVRTIFVCFALNPSALAESHPQHFLELVEAWNAFHPDVFRSSGYDAIKPPGQQGAGVAHSQVVTVHNPVAGGKGNTYPY